MLTLRDREIAMVNMWDCISQQYTFFFFTSGSLVPPVLFLFSIQRDIQTEKMKTSHVENYNIIEVCYET